MKPQLCFSDGNKIDLDLDNALVEPHFVSEGYYKELYSNAKIEFIIHDKFLLKCKVMEVEELK